MGEELTQAVLAVGHFLSKFFSSHLSDWEVVVNGGVRSPQDDAENAVPLVS
jgi:hypothetical protein